MLLGSEFGCLSYHIYYREYKIFMNVSVISLVSRQNSNVTTTCMNYEYVNLDE